MKVFLLFCHLVAVVATTPAYSFAAPLIPSKSDDFVEFLGVCANLHHPSYGGFDSTTYFYDVVKPRLEELGIRYVRDQIGLGNRPLAIHSQKLRSLGEMGIQVALTVGPNSSRMDEVDVSEQMMKLKMLITGGRSGIYDVPGGASVYAVTGSNEYDHMPSFLTVCPESGAVIPGGLGWYDRTTYCRPSWENKLIRFTTLMGAALKNDPVTQGIQYIAPPLVHVPEFSTQLSTNGKYLTEALAPISLVADEGSGNLYSWRRGHFYSAIPRELPPRTNFYAGKPITVLEMGYYTTRNSATDVDYSPFELQSKYIIRSLFDYFNEQSVSKVFLYELLDKGNHAPTPKESSFGLVGASGPKPIFHTLKNTIAFLKDSGPSFTPAPLDLQISSPELPETVHRKLLQRSDGSYVLALWNEESSSSVIGMDLTSRVSISLPRNMEVSIVRPSRSLIPISNGEMNSILVDVPDDLLLVELKDLSPPVPMPTETPTATSTLVPVVSPTPTSYPTITSGLNGCSLKANVKRKPGVNSLQLSISSSSPIEVSVGIYRVSAKKESLRKSISIKSDRRKRHLRLSNKYKWKIVSSCGTRTLNKISR